MPAELRVFGPLEWAEPGERPDAGGHARGDWDATWDYYRCHERYTGALLAWFDDHPDADIIEFLRADPRVT